jgi:hypothetical protein
MDGERVSVEEVKRAATTPLRRSTRPISKPRVFSRSRTRTTAAASFSVQYKLSDRQYDDLEPILEHLVAQIA